MEETIMRGRIPAGPEYVEHLQGSDKAKERLRVILETMMGKWRVGEACVQLGICEQRFRQLREELLQAAVDRLEDRPSGRPPRPPEPQDTAALRQQVAALQQELQVAQVREEIALALPQVNRTAADSAASPAAAPKKKRRTRR
jgi:Helix-turn-helix domain